MKNLFLMLLFRFTVLKSGAYPDSENFIAIRLTGQDVLFSYMRFINENQQNDKLTIFWIKPQHRFLGQSQCDNPTVISSGLIIIESL